MRKEEKEVSEKVKKPFWQRHFMSLFLFSLLVISVAWGFLNNKITVRRYENTLTELKQQRQVKMDSLNVAHVKDLSNTLALAVRSEMIAQNMQQIDQYFIQTVKMLNVDRILLVDPTNGKVLLSTNKKDNNTIFTNQALVHVKKATTIKLNENDYVSAPIMGLNTQLGTLIIQVN